MKSLILAYGTVSYLSFLAVILYMIGFVEGLSVPKDINSGVSGPLLESIPIDFALILLFGLSHSVMARPAFKERVTKFMPHAAERSTYVLVANIALAILFWQWRPISTPIWSFSGIASIILLAISMLGWVLVFWSTFLIDHFDLFGMRQVWLNYRGIEYSAHPFVVRGLYKYVRHPLMLGFLIAFWVTPNMTLGHLLFALLMTVYIFIGVIHEERDLARSLGDNYASYRERTSMIIPWR
ncbi:MAG: hypothetical protein K2X27_02130 [Candidatus Obscuribacterales bacterium]|nr:hypothetical protein [Candidatus Obscuribacterales bacterium]